MALTGETDAVLLEPTLGHALRIMWAWYWRYITLGFGPFGVALLLKVWPYQLPDDPDDLETMYFLIVALAASAPFWAFPYTFRMAMNRDFKNFRIGFADPLSTTPANFISPTYPQVWTVWWALTWRSALWGLACFLAVDFVVVAVIFGAIKLHPAWDSSLAPGTQSLARLLGWFVAHVCWFIASVFTLRRILSKDFEQFRIGLVSLA